MYGTPALRAVLVFFLLSFSSFGQDPRLTLTGVVRDEAGQAVSGASLIATSTEDGRKYQTHSGRNGSFSFTQILPGRYFIEASTRDLYAPDVEVLLAQANQTIDLTLRVRPLAATLTVVEQASPETRRVAGGTAVVREEEIQQSRAHNLKDALQYVPGVIVQSRFGSDESQLSVRGSGLRNNFHLRGINLLVNGIPYQDADGFSDFESLDLFATERVQVWKGANALQYGGSSLGGAINLVTYDAGTAELLSLRAEGGSFGALRAQVSSGAQLGRLGYFLSLSASDQDGHREHSEQSRLRLLGNLDWELGDRTTMRFDLIYADVDEELPGALTRAQFESAPRSANANNAANDFGRTFDYTRLAIQVRHALSAEQQMGFYVYGQRRDMIHPIFQILDQEAFNYGAEANYRAAFALAGRPSRFVAGVTYLDGEADERRFVNAGGSNGALTADFVASARSHALYLENQLEISPDLTLSTGGRFDSAGRKYDDRFLSDGDRSDERRFESFSPRLGLLWAPRADFQVFGNVSRSYEPPLILELVSFGAPGFLDLDAQSAWQYELGSRGRTASASLEWDLAVFNVELENEILNSNVRPFPGAPFTIPSYRNVDRSRHAGLEAGLGGQWIDLIPRGISHWRVAYTYSQFRFVNDPVFGNNDLPGAPSHLLRAQFRYHDTIGFWLAPALDWSPSSYYVDSANENENDAYAVLNLTAGFGKGPWEVIAGWNNVTDEPYSASVQVDSAIGTFFEPAQGRSFWLGLRWIYGS
ncbi:MAG TPA: TonB-dependent receptor [Thermoanaerobaculia bacterium]|nr:TonB-dependent receptor [Thermoanaerobaculia bacterium]